LGTSQLGSRGRRGQTLVTKLNQNAEPMACKLTSPLHSCALGRPTPRKRAQQLQRQEIRSSSQHKRHGCICRALQQMNQLADRNLVRESAFRVNPCAEARFQNHPSTVAWEKICASYNTILLTEQRSLGRSSFSLWYKVTCCAVVAVDCHKLVPDPHLPSGPSVTT
jgi:hypothetical protein